MENLIEVDNLSYHYGTKTALSDLSFTVGRGEIFGFLGPNGGGKTTTFKILSTLFSRTRVGSKFLEWTWPQAPFPSAGKWGSCSSCPLSTKN